MEPALPVELAEPVELEATVAGCLLPGSGLAAMTRPPMTRMTAPAPMMIFVFLANRDLAGWNLAAFLVEALDLILADLLMSFPR
ncbi:MAG: hypothetical protein A3F75_07600 [Betaproteobacteria bacterium RIFCSPLOWO2_12_FULL_64_23]|nr:MAG: hypothetical protein A3F75_07600 [Betaproteobacteria bacterium RIFCSPLOWO2_12_FULL_64_23]